MAKNKRESYIEKKVEFAINVGNFESLRVGTTFGETIEWSDLEERQKKLDALTKNLAEEVAKDAKEVMSAYGLRRKSTTNVEIKGKKTVNGLDEIIEDDEGDDGGVRELLSADGDDIDIDIDDEDFEI